MLDSHQFQNMLLQSKSRISKEENQLNLQQLQIKKDMQIKRAMIKHPLELLESEYYSRQLKTAYYFSCSNIRLLILLNYDFPTSDPQIFSTEYVIHKLIDSSTLEIKINKGQDLDKILDDLKEQFSKNPPKKDALVEEMNRNQNQEAVFHQLLENVGSADLRSIFPGVPPNQYKELVEGEKLGEYVVKLDSSRDVAQMLVERSQFNQILGSNVVHNLATILDIHKENERLKQQIQQNSQIFSDLINSANNAHMQCETIKKIYDDKELIRVLDQKIQNSENKSADLYENTFDDQEVDPKKLQKSIKEFLDIRKQFQLSKLKKKHFVSQLQIQVKKN